MIDVIVVSTPELGDRTYLVHDGSVAVAIDPQRDIDRLLGAALAAGVRIACVAETHIHNYYVSGGRALARELDVPYLIAAGEAVSFPHRAVHDGDEIALGASFSLRVLATPGHTPHHVSYVALEGGQPSAVCTGGSMLFGSAGRTDLFGPDHAAPLARQQYRSLHRLARLPEPVAVLPTHGFGSFCSVGVSAEVTASTIGDQRAANLAFVVTGESDFVDALLTSAPDHPRYYGRMAALNLTGMGRPDLTPPRSVHGDQLRAAACTDAWVVDLRPRAAFAAAHLARTINVEHTPLFTTYLGWLLPPDTPLVLIGESEDHVAHSHLDLTRIGIDHITGRYCGPLPPPAPTRTIRSYPARTFADLARALGQPGHVAVDVRRHDEWEAGHLDGAVHVALHDLFDRMAELPEGTLWVHCAAGFRAGIAASILERAGRDVVLVDDAFARAAAA